MNTLRKSKELINLDHLRQVCFGQENMLKELISVFLKNVPNQIKQLQKHFTTQDWGAFKSVAHQLKSSIKLLGISDTAEQLEKLETYATEKIFLNQIPKLMEIVNDKLAIVIAELEIKRKEL